MSKPVKMKFRLKKADGSEEIMEITQVTGLRDPEGKMTTMINFDKLPDGTWRFVYNDHHLKDKNALVAIEVIP